MPMSKSFDADSHAQFAALSGDFNPMHMDVVAARRTQAGAPVVHGMHTLLWLLDAVAARQPGLPKLVGLKARFLKMVYVGERVDAEIMQTSASALRARALVDGIEVVSLSLEFVPSLRPALPRLPVLAPGPGAAATPAPSSPLDLSVEQMTGRSGALRLAAPRAEIMRLFPSAAEYLGTSRIAALACTSCLVGMVVPGLHSLFGGLDLSVDEDSEATDVLGYAVTSVDQRYRLVRLTVRGGGLAGSLDSASRLPPVKQAEMAVVAPHMAGEECRGALALVIGGSRGIGELTAKLIAAGGGHVIVTYRHGQADAEAVAREIQAWGGNCGTAAYDARQDAAPQLARLAQAPTHVYYFATPTIFGRKRGLCDARRLDEFNAFYVTGFLGLVEACRKLRPAGVSAFYPSTVYVESRPAEMTEYAMAKAAGEILCADMHKYLRGVRVIARRLPRLPTDQTNSLLPTGTADALEVMAPIVRDMHGTPP
ncbi:MAG TPA: SDR family NAD(P)-dependent oxidoreductase [Steroidobacteraceae bacterium]